MLEAALVALAATCGRAVVAAAGTDLWEGFRDRLAGLMGRGDERHTDVVLRRLDDTAQALESGDDSDDAERVRQEASWQARFTDLLEELSEAERQQLAARLRELVAEEAPAAAPGGVQAGEGGLAVGGDVEVRADRGSVAATQIQGDVQIGSPQPPERAQG